MAKFREGNLVLTSSQKIKQGDEILVDANGVANFESLTVANDFNVYDLTVTGDTFVQEMGFLGGGATVDEFSTDGTLAGDSDTAVPTEKAVKTYVDGEITNTITYVDAEFVDTTAYINAQLGTAITPGTDERIARYDGTHSIQDSLVSIDNLGNITGVNNLTVTGIIDGDTTSSVSIGVLEVLGAGGSGSIGHPGGGSDLTIHNDVDSGFIYLTGTNSGSSVHDMIVCNPDAQVELYYNDVHVASTNEWGLTAFHSSSPTIVLSDNSNDLGYFWHDTTDLIIENEIDNGLITLRGSDSGSAESVVIQGDPNDAVTLYFDGIQAMKTSGDGVSVYDTDGNDPRLTFRDDAGVAVGYIEVLNDDIRLVSSGEPHIVGNADGSVDLYYNNVVVAQTTANGITGATWG